MSPLWPQKKWRRFLRLILFVAALQLAACSSKPPHPRWLWPVPPEQPRLEFIRTFSSDIDLLPSRKDRIIAKSKQQPADFALFFPFGLAGSAQQVLVADQDKRALWQYDLTNGQVRTLADRDLLHEPRDLAQTTSGQIYLIDQDRVLSLATDMPAQILVASGRLENPAYLTVDEPGQRLYVSDSKQNRVDVFDLEGQPLFTIGEPGDQAGQFHAPQGLAVDGAGQLYVADYFNARIQVFDKNGNYLRQFGQRGSGPADFEGPKDLAFDSAGRLYVVDSRKNALLTYTAAGQLLLVTGGGSGTAHPLGFRAPVAIDIDKNDRIYISDRLNQRISIWQYLTPAYLQKHPISRQDLEQIEAFMQKR